MNNRFDNCFIDIDFRDFIAVKELISIPELIDDPKNIQLKSDVKMIQNSDIIYISKLVCDDSAQIGSGRKLMRETLITIKKLPQFIGKNIIVTLIAEPLEQEGRLNKRRKFTTKEEQLQSLIRYYSNLGFIEICGLWGYMYGKIDDIILKCNTYVSKGGFIKKSRKNRNVQKNTYNKKNNSLKSNGR
jgi:hypothetical protein